MKFKDIAYVILIIGSFCSITFNWFYYAKIKRIRR